MLVRWLCIAGQWGEVVRGAGILVVDAEAQPG